MMDKLNPDDILDAYKEYQRLPVKVMPYSIKTCVNRLLTEIARCDFPSPVNLIAIHVPEGDIIHGETYANGTIRLIRYITEPGRHCIKETEQLQSEEIEPPSFFKERFLDIEDKTTIPQVHFRGVLVGEDIIITYALPKTIEGHIDHGPTLSGLLGELKNLGLSVADWELLTDTTVEKWLEPVVGERIVYPDIVGSDNIILNKALGAVGLGGLTVSHSRPARLIPRQLKDISSFVTDDGEVKPVAIIDPYLNNGNFVDKVELNCWSVANELYNTKANILIKENGGIAIDSIYDEESSTVCADFRPTKCPVCGSQLTATADDRYWCTNHQCKSKLLKQIKRLLSPLALDVVSLRQKDLKLLINAHVIEQPLDILYLDPEKAPERLRDLILCIINRLTKEKTISLGQALYGLSLPGITPGMINVINQGFNNPDKLNELLTTTAMKKTFDEVCKKLEDKAFIQTISQLYCSEYAKIKEETGPLKACFILPLKGKRISLIGPFTRASIMEMENELKLQGATVYTYLPNPPTSIDYYFAETPRRIAQLEKLGIPTSPVEKLYRFVDRIIPPWD